MVLIPGDKRYFRIGEVSRIVGVKPYILRYWESEFVQLRPSRADSRQRTYQRQDIEILLDIKQLLYGEGMTIKGAQVRLKQMHASKGGQQQDLFARQKLRRELEDLLAILSETP